MWYSLIHVSVKIEVYNCALATSVKIDWHTKSISFIFFIIKDKFYWCNEEGEEGLQQLTSAKEVPPKKTSMQGILKQNN